jgi:hypothetical protein
MKIEIEWHRPKDKTPPFRKEILVCLGSWESRGGPMRPKTTICQTTIVLLDGDDVAQKADLEMGTCPWNECQFSLRDRDGDDLDWYSDSIVWWAEVPDLPDERKP